MAEKMGFWDKVLHPEKMRQMEYEAEQSYITPQEKFWYEEYKRQNPEADMSMLGMDGVDSEAKVRQSKRDGPFKDQEKEKAKGKIVLGGKVGTFKREKVEDPEKKKAAIKKQIIDVGFKLMKAADDGSTLRDHIPEATRIVDPTEAEIEMDRLKALDKKTAQTGLYNEESQNPAMAQIPGMPGAGFEGAAMPPMGGQPPMPLPGQPNVGIGGSMTPPMPPPMPNVMPTQAQMTGKLTKPKKVSQKDWDAATDEQKAGLLDYLGAK